MGCQGYATKGKDRMRNDGPCVRCGEKREAHVGFVRGDGVDKTQTQPPDWLSANNTRLWAMRLMIARVQEAERRRVARAVRAMKGHRDWELVGAFLRDATPETIIDTVLEGVAQALEMKEGAEVEHV
jgi:hypothetical protein